MMVFSAVSPTAEDDVAAATIVGAGAPAPAPVGVLSAGVALENAVGEFTGVAGLAGGNCQYHTAITAIDSTVAMRTRFWSDNSLMGAPRHGSGLYLQPGQNNLNRPQARRAPGRVRPE